MKTLIFGSVLFLLGVVAGAQPAERFLTVGPGWSYATVLDEATSPLRYRGHNFLLSSSLEISKPDRLSTWQFLGWMGRIRPAANPGRSSSSSRFLRGEFRWTEHYRVAQWRDSTLHVFLGWGLLTKGVYRLHDIFVNNEEAFEYFNSASLEAMARYPFRLWGRPLRMQAGISAPLVSLTVYPLYNRGRPEGFLQSGVADFDAATRSLRVVTLDRYVRVSTFLNLDYPLANGNRFRLSYYWDFFHFAKENPVSGGLQGLYVSTLFNF